MDVLPPLPGPLPWPVADPRARHFVAHYSDMHGLVAGLILPEHAPAYVVSALETSRELIRHSYYRYEFTTVAVTHSLFALERALAEHLGVKKNFQQLIALAAAGGVISADLADRLDAGRQLRNKLAHGDLTGTALTPVMAVNMVRAAFDTAALLFPAPAA
ncbi:DUF4145 domain-containing protein [Kitasatospora sp. NPDC004669]|uniref:DUF4145 domain-containing protein n=1 Tax=Kitasatospora sp. NPDC004669 TaxID=3154555 RepID=UPI0033B17A54